MKNLITVLFLLLSFIIYSQEFPPIKSFTPKIYDGDNQNWAISQSNEDLIYVANNKGLLEYNGASWKLYFTSNQTVTRSVHVVNDKIYTGSYMDFGYWKKDNFGTLNYYSLSEKAPTLIDDEEFWNIINVKHWVLFQSLDRIYIYNTINDTFSLIEPESSIVKMYLTNDEVYFQVFNKGVFKIENGSAVKYIDDSKINDSRIVNIIDHKSGMLLLTAKKGFFHFTNHNLKPWNLDEAIKLEEMTIYNAKKLNDGSIVLGTISNGIFMLNSDGNIKYHINKLSGLQNNTVLSVFQDNNNNLWLGLDNGINFINCYSPFKIFNDFSGYLGTIYTSIIYDGILYLGTNQGLFYKQNNSDDEFQFVEGTDGQVWSLDIIDEELFCGHDNGTYIINNNKVNKIANIQGTWGVKPIEGELNLLLQGNYDGLHILEKKNGQWILRNKIEGFDISSRFFEFYDNKTLFISHEYSGLFKLKLDQNYLKAIEIEKQSKFKKNYNSGLIKYNNNIFYANYNGVFKFDIEKNVFKLDSILSQLYTKEDYISGRLINDNTNKLWSFSKYKLSYINSGSLSNNKELNSISLPVGQVNNVIGYENISQLNKEEYLIGTSNGYMIIDLSLLKNNKNSISINTIKIGTNEFKLEKASLLEDGFFENKTNSIYFSYNIPEYYKYLEMQYQYQLEGYNNLWSEWSKNSSHLFENLPSGDYTFKVKGKIGNKITTNTATFNFTIKKPWYLSNLFIVIYIVLGIFILLIVHLIYRNYYKKQQKIILKRTQKDIELKELENKQQFVNFQNKTLLQNIDNKNRELAISTMSLIKKNEFLSSITDELKKIKSNNDLKYIIKLIDKNINNTNDWELFQEAFNNADKDFLKKVKSKHPSLTSKDLRLCAYLRLNLTSKEIAPLFNISPRSVEVKRYRLRKKMSLKRDTSLADYILDI